MTIDVSSLWVSTWHEKGALHAMKLQDYLREVNEAWAAGRRPEKWVAAVTPSLEAALDHNRKMKRAYKPQQPAEVGP